MEAVVRGLVERGHRISVDADSHNASVAFVNGERLVFGLKEKVARRDRELSAAELRERKQNPYRYWPHEYTYTPTSDLTFSILDEDVYGVPLVWRDGKRRKIEDCLNDIVFGFARVAERLRFGKSGNVGRKRSVNVRGLVIRRLWKSKRRRANQAPGRGGSPLGSE